ncbi:TetR/AcrR family transcriptional regulator [Kitasatospora sp. NA04385]|uniref:TetR/AcrR family transcriptional regulator n=1 Tax=Kitasatospora sp. NA04385 TaxID=2742135 RepID=UPI0015920542|nr:TetR/AcrR family transcriptional regulator [Kitasatospora sp. NA04385]QKW18857.1 TetR/AcrR family transcriptional regulator [Kitasatospora sp. NA04385]
MAIKERRARERAERERLIVRAARELAEAEGWDAVTTRRLAERIEYSQPVLYSHFSGKDAIVAAVAVEGCAELAALLRAAAADVDDPREAFAAVARGYLAFAEANPALYDAIFTLPSTLPFGTPEAPAPLHEAFAAIAEPATRSARACGHDPGGYTELAWSALHGMVTLARNGRLRPDLDQPRIDAFTAVF